MPCCQTCACRDQPFECLAVVAPGRYRHFAEWCRGDDPSQRMLVRDLSRMGLAAIDAMNPRTPRPTTITEVKVLNRHAERDALVRCCAYRLDAVGLERGGGCGCTPATRCLLRRGKWPDDPFAVDYGDCLSCVS